MISDPDPYIDGLLRWCSACGIQIDARIRVVRGEDGSICVLARDRFIETRTTLVSIPKSAVLSTKTCALSEHIPQLTYGKEAQLGLALALYSELLRGSSSLWFGYLASLPKHVSLPLFWDDANDDEKLALSWIKGTMVEVELSKSNLEKASALGEESELSITDLLRYYESTALPTLANTSLGDHATFEGLKHAYSLVSSRSFIADAYHGLAMVPIADAEASIWKPKRGDRVIFNHSLENQVHLESDHEVCRLCGSLTECPHDIEGEENDEHSRSLLPSTAADAFENTCDMVTNAPILPFSEVFNTYGEHLTNAQLLVRYGFVLDVNENDVILWDGPSLCQFAHSFSGSTNVDEDHSERIETSYKHEDSARQRAGANQKSIDPIEIFGQPVLRRLEGVLELWDRDEETFSGSDLIYLPKNTRTESKGRVHGVGTGANNQAESMSNASFRSRKCILSYFALDSETRISHHLWIFCVLLALHSRRPHFNISSEAVRRLKSTAELTLNVPKRDEDAPFRGRYASGLPKSHCEDCHLEVDMASARYTSVSEDITIVKHALLIQKYLEKSDPNSQAEMSLSDIMEEFRNQFPPPASRTVAMEDERINASSRVSIAQEQRQRGVEVPPSTFLSVSEQIEEYPTRAQKRARRGSTISNQEDGFRERVRMRRGEQAGSCESGEAFEEAWACEDRMTNISEERIPVLGGLAPDANRQGQNRNDGLLSRLLEGYGDESDDAIHYSSGSDIEFLSAAGGGGLGQEHQYQENTVGTGCLADIVTRKYPDRGSVARQPEKEGSISNWHDRPFKPILSPSNSATEEAHFCADAELQSFDSSGTRTGGLTSELVREQNVTENACLDALRLVASTARIICALCDARSRDMAYPNSDAAELGNVVDGIPLQMVQTRMAAQLALDERVRLEGCIAVWEEIERAASRYEIARHGSTSGV